MANRIAQLEKLRGKSLHEIRVRGRQELAKLNERILGAGSVEMTDAALLREIRPESRNGTGEGSAMLILERVRLAPSLPSLNRREEMAALIEQRFPDARLALLDRAERAILGRFDLLGLTNLSFGDPIEWRLDPTSGKRTPLVHWSKIDYLDPSVAGDKKVTWELNRHAHFVTLGQAYWLTGDERFADAFTSHALSWMDENPWKLGINWASSLELSIRVIAWIWALHLFSESDRLTPNFVSRFVKYLVAQGCHIESYLSHYFSPNTHLTGEALGLFYLGTALPELGRARRWREAGLRVLLEQLPRHIRRDGTYFEQSSYYHRYTVDFYTHLVALARAANVKLPREVEERLSPALDHLMFITRPDGATPIFGDDDGGRLLNLSARRANDFRDTLAAGAALYGRGDWKFVAGEATVEMLWLLGSEWLGIYDRIEATEPDETSRAFPEGGYFVMRDGWSANASFVLADCGPHGSFGCGHAHADALAFEYAGHGKSWVVDPGTFTYTGDASLRDDFRTTEAHNTVTVDGRPQSVPAGPFAWNHIAQADTKEFIADEAFDYFKGSHDGYERLDDPLTHSRSLLFLKRDDQSELPAFVVVRDQFVASEQHEYAVRYHFAPGCAVNVHDNAVKATASDDELSISAFAENELKVRTVDGRVSSCYGQCEVAPVALFETRGEGPQQIVSFLVPPKPGTDGAPWPPCIEEGPRDAQEGAATERRSDRVFLISAGTSRDTLILGEQAGDVTHGQLTAAGSVAWSRLIAGRFTRGCLISGNRFEVSGCIAFHSPMPVRSCGFRIDGGAIQITIQGGRQFSLSFNTPPTSVEINHSSFDMASDCLSARFVLEDSGWKLVDEG